MLKIHITILGTGFKRLAGLGLSAVFLIAIFICFTSWIYGLYQFVNCSLLQFLILPKQLHEIYAISWWLKPHNWIAIVWTVLTLLVVVYRFGLSTENEA
jgi:hypothetical protein